MKTIKRLILLMAAPVALAACISPAAEKAEATGAAEHGRFHHVHLNVSDVGKTSAFYQKIFGVTPVYYAGRAPALMAERAFICLNQLQGPIPSQLQTGVIHIGWSGIDGPSEFEWLKAQGVEFYTPLTPFLGAHYMYL